jgi:carbonic anhydrase/acetyltransferase-like protein (isoleucine patch superfamily)
LTADDTEDADKRLFTAYLRLLRYLRSKKGHGASRQNPYNARVASIHPTAFLHPAAFVCGDVTLGSHVSVWPTAVIRGDSARIEIGDDSNIQDGTVVHVDDGVPAKIGKRVAVGHRAIIHGATVEDDCLIAMGAILLNRTTVASGSIVGAGAVCTEGFVVPPNSLVLGVPAKVVRQTTMEERKRIRHTVSAYLELQKAHRAGSYPGLTSPKQ